VGDGKIVISVKSYVTNTINLSCTKILLPSVIDGYQIKQVPEVSYNHL